MRGWKNVTQSALKINSTTIVNSKDLEIAPISLREMVGVRVNPTGKSPSSKYKTN
jgi:hypothetical protein